MVGLSIVFSYAHYPHWLQAMFAVLREEFLEYERELEDNASNYHKMLHNNTTLPVWMVCLPPDPS